MDTPLKKAREQKGIPQQQMANACDKNLRTYQRYESGERVPDVHAAIRMADELDSDVKILFPLPQ